MKHARSDYARVVDLAAVQDVAAMDADLGKVIQELQDTVSELATMGGLTATMAVKLTGLRQILKRMEGLRAATTAKAVLALGQGVHPIADDEPVFLLRAKDQYFVPMVLTYAALLSNGGQHTLRRTAIDQAALGEAWQEGHGKRQPDMPEPFE